MITDLNSVELKSALRKLSDICYDCFNNNLYQGESQGVFRSHFDWHSSVHAHWTLLSTARLLNDERMLNIVKERLCQAALMSEQKRLELNPEFELPYGQAWLLLLFNEMEKQDHLVSSIQVFKQQTINRVVKWLESTDVEAQDSSPYKSWLLIYFLLKKSKCMEATEFVHELKKLDQKLNSITTVRDRNDPKDFFSAESLFSILKNERKFEIHMDDVIDQLIPVTYENCHQVGKLVTKSWMSPRNHEHSRELTLQFIQKFTGHTELWRDDFATVSHWVPQFLWFGLWLSMGEP